MKFTIKTDRVTKIAAIVATSVVAFLPATAWGVTIVPSCARGSTVPQLDCVLSTFGNIAQLILAVSGGLALLMFVYGGFLMLSSGGMESRVTKGKEVIKTALVGLAIILLAGYLIRYGLERLGVREELLTVPKTAPAKTDKIDSEVSQDFILTSVGGSCCPHAGYECCSQEGLCAGVDCGPEEASPAPGMCTITDADRTEPGRSTCAGY
jgi:hypothetical protein